MEDGFLAEPDIEPFLRWYAYRHAPDVFRAGFSTCACYRTDDGGMNLFDIYEIPSSSLFEAPYYRGMRGRDPYMDALMAKRRNSTPNLVATGSRSAWLLRMTGTSTVHSPEWLRARMS